MEYTKEGRVTHIITFQLRFKTFHVILSEYYKQEQKEVFRMTIFKKAKNVNKCPYCSGQGYFQLRLGGSETCSYCSGSGKK